MLKQIQNHYYGYLGGFNGSPFGKKKRSNVKKKHLNITNICCLSIHQLLHLRETFFIHVYKTVGWNLYVTQVCVRYVLRPQRAHTQTALNNHVTICRAHCNKVIQIISMILVVYRQVDMIN